MCFYKGEDTEKKNVDKLLKLLFNVSNRYYISYLILIFWQIFQAMFPLGIIYLFVGS
jgi:hypothetical protein